MSFDKQGYLVIKQAIPKDLAIFVYNYFLIKRQVAQTMFDSNYIAPFETIMGLPKGDEQVPGAYAHYGDIAMDTLMLRVQPLMEKETGLRLIPTYSYARIYQKGSELKRHKDRFSCEISTTMNLGGDNWSIFIDPSGEENKKGNNIILNPGDMLVYKGNLLEHWREPFNGEECCQVFLHYNNANTPGSEKNIYDGRKHIGLPSYFRTNNHAAD
jgi:hypothetical protein